mmetsp:Transcript_38378/g.76899  ORF Transcript_38378/g.76899 Transcript_38378/m.76899 type:complete len:268 (+) Transcript_38378:260-1063(+)
MDISDTRRFQRQGIHQPTVRKPPAPAHAGRASAGPPVSVPPHRLSRAAKLLNLSIATRAASSLWSRVGSQFGSWPFFTFLIVLFFPANDCQDDRRSSTADSSFARFSERLNILSFRFLRAISSSLSSGRISIPFGSLLPVVVSGLASGAVVVDTAVAAAGKRIESSSTSTTSDSPVKRSLATSFPTLTILAGYHRESATAIAVTSVPGRHSDVSGRTYCRTSLKSTCAVFPYPRKDTKKPSSTRATIFALYHWPSISNSAWHRSPTL